MIGENDALIPAEHRDQITEALTQAGVDNEVVIYSETAHGFLSERRDSYNPSAADDAWRHIRQLLATPGMQPPP